MRRSTTLPSQRIEDGGLDRLFGHVQRAQHIPAVGDLGEIGRGLRLLRRAHGFEPLAVAQPIGIVGVELGRSASAPRSPPGPFGASP